MTCSQCGRGNPPAAKFCNECGAALAAPEPPREQRKTVTVLFCDVSGSTALGERLDPEALRQTMSSYFDVARAAIERHGGTVEKFIGDAVMAVFGVPTVHEDDALRAVRAAVELRDAVEIDVRIGVNTGEVVTGTGDTLVTGDAVNVAARLEQAAGVGEVLLGGTTYALVRDAVDAELLPPLEAKGKSQPVTAYRLRAVTGELQRRNAAPMVGRERELELLSRAFERTAHEHACHLFTVLGTAGIGKSRLVAEFLGSLAGARVVYGRCLSYGEGITYWPAVSVLKQLDVPVESVLRDGTTPQEIAWSVRKTLEEAALDGPLVVVLDDIQWGEPAFLDLVEHVADLSRGAPILLLCMARPELVDLRPGWGGGKLNATSVLLEPLPMDETGALVHALFAEAEEDLVARIRDAADGNPLFVEEMVELARASGGEVAVPPTIHALLTARLDSLPAEERVVLERGAVEGQVFHRSAVAALAPEELQVDSRLVSLVRKELVRPDQPAFARDDAYRFRHLLIRDAAYEALPKATRIDLHERFAAWLEEHGGDLVELDEIVGYHLEQAARYAGELGRPAASVASRAARHLGAAARRAAERGDVTASVKLGRRAVALHEPDDPQRVALLPRLAEALWESGEFDESRALLDEAVERGDPATAARARVLRAVELSHGSAGRHARSLAEVDAALAVLEEDAELAQAYVAKARLLYWAGRIREMRTAAELGREHARAAGDIALESDAVRSLLVAIEFLDTPRAEVERVARDVLDDQRWGTHVRIRALLALGRASAVAGRFDEADSYMAEKVRLDRELGAEINVAGHGMHLALLEWLRGDWERMEARVRPGWDRLGELGEVGYRSTVGATLAVALAELGRDEEALAIAAASAAMTSPDDYVTQAWALWAESRVASNAGEHARAIELAERARDLVAATDDMMNQLVSMVSLAEAHAAAEAFDEAAALADEVAAIAGPWGGAAFVARARRSARMTA